MKTKEIIMGASVFISANGFICALARAYKRACTCLHVRALGKRMQTKLRVFCDLLQLLYTLVSEKRRFDPCGHKHQGQRPAGAIYVPRQE